MKRIIFDPTKEPVLLPTRRSPLKDWKLNSIESALLSSPPSILPEIIVFERRDSLLVADGNHRIAISMKHQQPIEGIQLEEGEEFTLHGNPLLNYGKHRNYAYQNFGLYGAFIDYCRIIALSRGYRTFSDLFAKTFAQENI